MSTVVTRIAKGRTDLVFDHVASGQPATATDADGTRLIQWCAYYGDVSAMRLLLDRGESFDIFGENLDLGAAAFHGHWRLCEFLLERGAQVNHRDSTTGETALHAAVSQANRVRHDVVVRVLLAHGADPNISTVPGIETGAFMRDCRTKGETALHRAAAFGGDETLDLLLSAGASRETKDVQGDTPLSWGSWYGRPDAILRRLCYGDFRIHPNRKSMEAYVLGEP
jgi:ankyrin repeat protein